MSRPRVLWLIKGLGLGGAERLLTTMASKINQEDFDVEVAYLLPEGDHLARELQGLAIRTICLDARWTAEAGWPNRLRQLLRRGAYDLIHTHSPVPAVAARMLAPRGTVLVHTEHNLWGSYRRPTYLANAATYGRNTAVLAVSDAVRTSIRRPRALGGPAIPPVETLHHGVEIARLARGPQARAAARTSLGFDDETPLIGTVASFTPQKNHEGLLEALLVVFKQLPDARLLLVGSGPLQADVERWVAARALGEHVIFLGPRTDLPALLPALDVFALASWFEGLPIAMLEAMGSGVACVATAVGGVPEAMRSGIDGLLVSPGEPAALGNAILDLLQDHDQRRTLARAGCERVAADFSIDRAVRRTMALYAEVLS